MFQPNAYAMLQRRSDKTNRRGEFTYATAVRVPCALIDMSLKVDKTSVRADSSGSRGRALEEMGEARILFPTYVKVKEGDVVTMEEEILEVVAIFPRRNLLGRLDHYDVVLTKAQAV